MRTMSRTLSVVVIAVAIAAGSARAQAFSSGSDGSDGELFVDVGQSLVVPLPADGILRYSSVTVSTGATLSFLRNARNTPVQLLAQGPVEINGTVTVAGLRGSAASGGLGGPGGFDGGEPGLGLVEPGDGHGPGAGRGGTPLGTSTATVFGGAGHATRSAVQEKNGVTYGSSLLIPLEGGSGGGGSSQGPAGGAGAFGGHGGGGCILIASDVSVTVSSVGKVLAFGSPTPIEGIETNGGPGSGGSIRIVAPRVLGSGVLTATGGHMFRGFDPGAEIRAGDGRIRVDTLARPDFALRASPIPVIGGLMLAIPAAQPRLDIVHCAGTDIPPDSGPVLIVLPGVALASQVVTVRATGFSGVLPIRLRLIPESGVSTTIDDEIDMAGAESAELDVDAIIPPNVRTRVEVYTR